MRILFLCNNRVGLQILQWLMKQNEEIVGLVVHPPGKQKYVKEIINSSQLDRKHIFEGPELREQNTLDAINALKPDLGLSIFFGYILKPQFLEMFPEGVINLHPSYLPYNRGQYPNVWSIIEETPAGVSLHYIDPGIDTGDIVAQRKVVVEPIDTGKSLYRKLEKACTELFRDTWPSIRSGKVPRIDQSKEKGTFHLTREVEKIDCIDLDRKYRARDLINILRARTFSPYPGAYFNHRDRKVFLRLQLMYEHDIEEPKI